MTKNKIFATIAVALIAGAAIFAACTKEDNKDTHPFAQNKDYVEYFTDGTLVLATYQIGSNNSPIFNFNHDNAVSILEDSASAIVGYDVVLESLQIVDDSLRIASRPAFLKASFYCPTLEEGNTYYLQLDKIFEVTGSEDEGKDTTIYYALPDGGNNTGSTSVTRTFRCKNKGCSEACTYDYATDNTGNVTIFNCDCPVLDNHDKCVAKEIGALGVFFARLFGTSGSLISINVTIK